MRGTIKWSHGLASLLGACLAIGCSGDTAERKYMSDEDPSAETDGGDKGNNGGSATAGMNTAGDAGSTGGKPDAGPANPLDACGDGKDSLTTGLRITQVAVYQTIKIPVYDAGTWVTTRVADLVQGKSAMVRVFYEVLPGWTKHNVRGVITLDNGGTPKLVSAELAPSATSVESQLNTTFNFDIDGADIGPNTNISVALVETKCPATLGNATDVRVPAVGTQALGARRIGKLRVVLVPINVPSGQAAIPSATQLEEMRNALRAFYPIPDVELTLNPAINSSTNITRTGGWPQVLSELSSLRASAAQTGVTRDVYYYGLVTPAATLQAYCGFGCTMGIANQIDDRFLDRAASRMAGMGGGWANEESYDTMVHELGHIHGLPHAPCVPPGGQISGSDPSYPYPGGVTNTWGYDFRDKTLQPPTDTDIMGYCQTTWISDYYYKKLMTRSQTLNQSASLQSDWDPRTWENVIVGGPEPVWGAPLHGTDDVPNEMAEALDATGAKVADVEVVRVALSDDVSSFIYFAGREPSWDALRLSDRTIRFADVAGSSAQ